MNILYICTYYHRAMVFRDSMNYLEKEGNRVLAFNAAVKGAKIDEKYKGIMDNKVVHAECFYSFDRYLYFVKQRKIRKSICEKVDLASWDVIHSHTLFNGGWAAYQISRRYDIPYIVSVRNTDVNAFLKYSFFKGIARKIVQNASAIMFLSESYKNKFLEIVYDGKNNTIIDKCFVIPNGLEPFWIENVFQARRSVHQPLRLLCVGKIDKNKNVFATVGALNKLIERGWDANLVYIGQIVDKDVMNYLESAPRVSVIPYLKKEQLIDYYRESDIFVMPSFKESFGRVYAEAMTQGVPVIYTRGQGFDDNFPRGYVGYDVDPNNCIEIADAIESIVKDYPIISNNCIESCKAFNWDRITEKLLDMYEFAVSKER